MIYVAKKDITILNDVIFRKGDEIQVDDGKFKIGPTDKQFEIPITSLGDNVTEKKNNINVSVQPIEEAEDVVQTWRLQLDVKTTRKKAREIENFLRQNLEKMI